MRQRGAVGARGPGRPCRSRAAAAGSPVLVVRSAGRAARVEGPAGDLARSLGEALHGCCCGARGGLGTGWGMRRAPSRLRVALLRGATCRAVHGRSSQAPFPASAHHSASCRCRMLPSAAAAASGERVLLTPKRPGSLRAPAGAAPRTSQCGNTVAAHSGPAAAPAPPPCLQPPTCRRAGAPLGPQTLCCNSSWQHFSSWRQVNSMEARQCRRGHVRGACWTPLACRPRLPSCLANAHGQRLSTWCP